MWALPATDDTPKMPYVAYDARTQNAGTLGTLGHLSEPLTATNGHVQSADEDVWETV